MLRLAVFFACVAAAAWVGAWVAEHPGSVDIVWLDRRVALSTTVAVALAIALMGLTLLAYASVRAIVARSERRRQDLARAGEKQGMRALLDGMIASAAGDHAGAHRLAATARDRLPGEPAVALLEAEAARGTGEPQQAKARLAAMTDIPALRLAGLRGLYLEARAENQDQVAAYFAEQAAATDPQLAWPKLAAFEAAVASERWEDALALMDADEGHAIARGREARRWRAVLLTAAAVENAHDEPRRARGLALEAHALAPDLVPAAALAARLSARFGETERAIQVLETAWRRAPHPDLAEARADIAGKTPSARLAAIRDLAALAPDDFESIVAVAAAALEAADTRSARAELARLAGLRPTRRLCVLMAGLAAREADEAGHRAWLARALDAPADAAWVADGVVADHWAPVSPATGRLDAFEWTQLTPMLEERPLAEPRIGRLGGAGPAPLFLDAAASRGGFAGLDAATEPMILPILETMAPDAADKTPPADRLEPDAPAIPEASEDGVTVFTSDVAVFTDVAEPGDDRAEVRGHRLDDADDKAFEEIRKALLARTYAR